jgi:hypothetical protein
MVPVEVQGEIFQLSDTDVEGSKTIENLLNYNSSINEPILINVNLNDWHAYLDFLNDNQADIGALKVIDYLDNLSQARLWCELTYILLKKKYENQSKEVYTEGAINKLILSILSDIIDRYTEFTIGEVLPFKLLSEFEDILQRIEEQGNKALSTNDIDHIVYTLYSTNITGVY